MRDCIGGWMWDACLVLALRIVCTLSLFLLCSIISTLLHIPHHHCLPLRLSLSYVGKRYNNCIRIHGRFLGLTAMISHDILVVITIINTLVVINKAPKSLSLRSVLYEWRGRKWRTVVWHITIICPFKLELKVLYKTIWSTLWGWRWCMLSSTIPGEEERFQSKPCE